MKKFIRLAILGIFYNGVRKFITLAGIIYFLMSSGDNTQIAQDYVDFDESSDEYSLNVEKLEGRLPASIATNKRKRSKTKARFEKRLDDFSSLAGNPEGLASRVSNFSSGTGSSNNYEGSSERSRKTSSVSGNSNSSASSDGNSSDNANSDSSSSDSGNSNGSFIGGGTLLTDIDNTDNGETTPVEPRTETNGSNTISCSSDQAEGIFGSSISLVLSCSETANIQFCVQQGGGCCSPLTSPTSFSGSVDLNSGDGEYCVSFFGTGNGGEFSSVSSLTYTIDSTLPDLNVNFPTIQIQTTELPLTNSTQSTDFGEANHFYHQINLKSHDPGISGLDLNCSDILSTYTSLSSPVPVVIETELDTSSNGPADQISQTIDSGILVGGDNFIVTIFEDRSRNVFSCQTQRVVLNDVIKSDFTGTGATAVLGGVRRVSGQFVGFGHFQAAPIIDTSSGENENEQSGVVNKTDLLNVFY